MTDDELYAAAQRSASQGDPVAGVALMQARVDAAPGDALTWRRLAALQVAAGDRSAALIAASRAIELAPERPGGYLVRAGISLLEQRYRLVVVDAERALAVAPGDPDALIALANGVLFADHDAARARELVRQVRSAAPGHPGAARLGRVLRIGRWRGLTVAAGPAVGAGFIAIVGAVFILEPPAPQLFWLLGPGAFFLAGVVVVGVVARLRLPLVAPGPGALAAWLVGAAILAGGAGWVATASLRVSFGVELLTALIGALMSVRAVRVWVRRRPAGPASAV